MNLRFIESNDQKMENNGIIIKYNIEECFFPSETGSWDPLQSSQSSKQKQKHSVTNLYFIRNIE